ncbi:M4 family metallopeptidase [Streptomyces sp. NBC_00237]|uniref:M4 family metallopeptidase n=1 Tax=Streptomyces sp. NBC_00237 TaxID=2975687 RepID=UPI00225692A2|nr:M4 family metallopeptidase [Streptomyces sp. NBC_00237]MCX5204249.1 M4 family metallopeptidase [Streptomyces sp. NBC_00237]
MHKTRVRAVRPGITSAGISKGVAATFAAAALLAGVVPAAQAAPAAPAGPTAEVIPGTDTATPALVDGINEPAKATGSAADAAVGHLAEKQGRYRIGNPQGNLKAVSAQNKGGTETVRLQQRYKGLEVLGGEYVVRMENKGGKRNVVGTSGKYFTALSTGTTATVSEKTAVQRAVAAVARELGGKNLTLKDVRKAEGQKSAAATALTGTAGKLVVLPQGKGVLTRQVTVKGNDPVTGEAVLRQVYIDAKAGFPVLQYSSIKTFGAPKQAKGAAPKGAVTPAASAAKALGPGDATGTGVKTDGTKVDLNLYYDTSRKEYTLSDYVRMQGSSKNPITTWDARGVEADDAAGKWPSGIKEFGSPVQEFGKDATDAGAIDAQWAATEVYDYYKSKHNRDSLDGRGMTINSLVGVTNGGQSWVNAFWDGSKMVYGSGDDEYKPLASDVDVVGHEMTHGVVENTANLVYVGQSGALNEAVADYFGNAIDTNSSGTSMDDPNSGLLGEDLCRTLPGKECALRDLNDGRTTSKDFLGVSYDVDNGGVHLNSTIFSGALWDIRQDIDKDLADRIVYKALAEYLTPLDGFTEGRNAVVAAAKDLKVSAKDLKVITRSFNAHGIVAGWEDALGMDSDTLLGKLNTSGTGAGAGGGQYAVSKSNDDGSEPYSVYTGRTDGKGSPKLVSPNDGRFHVYPATDGKNVVWAAFGTTSIDVLVRPVAGGPIKKVWSSSTGLQGLRIDGDLVVWEENDPFGGRHAAYKNLKTNEQAYVDGGRYHLSSALPSVKNGKVAYAKLWPVGGQYKLDVELLDTATKKTSVLPQNAAVEGLGQTGLSKTHVSWLVDEVATDGGQMAVRRANLDGTKLLDLSPETGAKALYAFDLTASEEAVTVNASLPDTQYRNETLPKLWQFDAAGIREGERVSCNRGDQVGASADTGKRVVWIDGTTSNTDLVVRDRAAGRC